MTAPNEAKSWLVGGGVALCAAAVIGLSQPRVSKQYATTNTLEATYALPDPQHLIVFSLGYRSALADLLFGQTLVAAGIHFAERKVFEHLDGYLEAIVTLEPGYRDVYEYADALLTLSTVEMPKRNYRIARDLLMKGLDEFPDDARLWMATGQFIAFLAPQHLPPEEDPDEWRRVGAGILEHACNIWPTPDDLPPACLSTSTILSRLGETDAAIRSLERLVALAEDPDVRAEAEARLQKHQSARARELHRRRIARLSELHLRDLPLADRTEYQLVGPPWEPTECVGRRRPPKDERCVTSFRAWGQLNAAVRDSGGGVR